MAAIASRLANDEKIQKAIEEVGRRYVGAVAPSAFHAAARNLLARPEHRDHGRSIAALFCDRQWPIEHRQRVDVHKHDSNAEELAHRMVAELRAQGIDEHTLLKMFGRDLLGPPLKQIEMAPVLKPEPVLLGADDEQPMEKIDG